MRLFGFKDVVFAVGQSNAVQCVRNRCASRIDSFCASALHSEVLPVLQGPARCGMRCCVGIGPPSQFSQSRAAVRSAQSEPAMEQRREGCRQQAMECSAALSGGRPLPLIRGAVLVVCSVPRRAVEQNDPVECDDVRVDASVGKKDRGRRVLQQLHLGLRLHLQASTNKSTKSAPPYEQQRLDWLSGLGRTVQCSFGQVLPK